MRHGEVDGGVGPGVDGVVGGGADGRLDVQAVIAPRPQVGGPAQDTVRGGGRRPPHPQRHTPVTTPKPWSHHLTGSVDQVRITRAVGCLKGNKNAA